MSAKITVGPPVLTINKGSTFIVTDYSGEIDPREAHGVFADDTRFVSAYRLRINGQPWQRISSATVSYYAARIFLTNPPLQDFTGRPLLAADVLALELFRAIDDGVFEELQITNYGPERVDVMLELGVESDFADLFEVKGGQIEERENLVTRWDSKHQELETTYERADYHCRFAFRVIGADPPPSYANGNIRLPIHLEPGTSWRAQAQMLLQHGGRVHRPRLGNPASAAGRDPAAKLHDRWLNACTRLEASEDALRHTYEQSVEDMGALRLFDEDLGPDLWVPAAGVPWFVALFGRDSLIAALQNLIVHARFAEGALRTLAAYQADERDDWRDAQPGKIVHELRHGELAHFNVVPHARYYGTWDATSLFLIVLHQAWRWLGDRRLVEALRPAAERCLEWIDVYGDLDGDGFQEYQTYSPNGYNNMGWKDAHDAVVYPDGSQVPQPKALCELQAYVYAAKLGMAELYAVLGESERARALTDQAAELKRRFNAAFWMPDEGTYAFGLDPDKRQIRTIASNAGHCLWTGIADEDKAASVAERLLAPDMWSGWGIRTLSASNPAYDPFSYQRGSVWPHDNAIIAAGLCRYGCTEAADRVTRAIIDAAAHFQNYRLPEVFAGVDRCTASFPVQYRGANIPQAWAAGSVFQLIQAMLGLDADAANERLVVNPVLPEWLPWLTLSGLQVGSARVSLRFWREGAGTRFAVESLKGGKLDVEAVNAPPQDSKDEGAVA